MTSAQENKLSMYRAVMLFSLDTVWTSLIGTVPALQNAFAELAHLIEPIEESATGQTTSTQQSTGATSDKKQRKENLVIAVNAVSGPLYARGAELGDNEMKAVANVSPSSLKAMRDDLLTSRATSVLALAPAHATALQPYGVSAAHLTALLNQRTTWAANTQRPRQAKAAAKGHRTNLTVQFKAADTLLKERLDRLMLPFKASHPSFHAVYVASRVIHDNAASAKKPPTPPPPTP